VFLPAHLPGHTPTHLHCTTELQHTSNPQQGGGGECPSPCCTRTLPAWQHAAPQALESLPCRNLDAFPKVLQPLPWVGCWVAKVPFALRALQRGPCFGVGVQGSHTHGLMVSSPSGTAAHFTAHPQRVVRNHPQSSLIYLFGTAASQTHPALHPMQLPTRVEAHHEEFPLLRICIYLPPLFAS